VINGTLMDHTVKVYLMLLETTKLSSKVPVLFCIPTCNEWMFLLLCVFTSIGIVSAVDFGHYKDV
jgi:hypothetical protein